MELASLIARVSQLEKDVAEARAKVFFLEAVIHEQRQRTVTTPSIRSDDSRSFRFDPEAYVSGGLTSSGEDSVPQRRVSPFSFAGFSAPTSEEETLGSEFQVTEEMFDGDL